MRRDATSEQGGATEVVKLLEAAERIADGLAALALSIYERDPRWKNLLAASNAASVHAQEALREAEQTPWTEGCHS